VIVTLLPENGLFPTIKESDLLSWKARLDVTLKLAEDSIDEVGQDLTRFFGPLKLCDMSNECPSRSGIYLLTTGGSVSELSGTSMQSDGANESKIWECYKRTGVPFVVNKKTLMLH